MASLVFGLTIGAIGLAGGSSVIADRPSVVPKVFVCHATGSESNPYVKIEVARSAINGSKGHSGHTGPVWYPGAKAAGVVWGDIIPPVAFITAGLNWPEGEATFLNGDCELPGVNSTATTVKSTATTVKSTGTTVKSTGTTVKSTGTTVKSTGTTVKPTATTAVGVLPASTGVSPAEGGLPSSDELPATGRSTTGMVLLGAFSVVFGAMLLGLKRKPAIR